MKKYLLDTHALLWFLFGDEKLSNHSRSIIEDTGNIIFVSIASLWEISIKISLKKLILPSDFSEMFPLELEKNDINILSINIPDLEIIKSLPFFHKDPFDRILIAQAMHH